MSALENNPIAPRKVGQCLFIGILVLHLIACAVLGFISLTNPQLAFETGFQMPFDPDLRIFSVIIGMQVTFLGSMALLGIIWTRRKSLYGIYVGTAVGIYLLVFGFIALLILGDSNGLIVDSSRGLVTLIFAYMAFKELKNN